MLHPEYFANLAALILFGAAVVAAPTLASASPTSEARQSKSVRYGDLDLSKRDGASRLYARIRRAAQDMCRGDQWSPVQIDCYAAAVNEAVAKVNQPLLSALVARHSPAARGARMGT